MRRRMLCQRGKTGVENGKAQQECHAANKLTTRLSLTAYVGRAGRIVPNGMGWGRAEP